MDKDGSKEPTSQGDEKQRTHPQDVATDKLNVMVLNFYIWV